MIIKVIVADDESRSGEILGYMLQRIPEVAVIGLATNAEDALRLASQGGVNAFFLDIRMPGTSGMDLAKEIRVRYPAVEIIFSTAYDNYAQSAFELDAVDYLLKPYEPARVEEAARRLRRRLEDRNQRPVSKRLVFDVEENGSRKTVFLEQNEILFLEALGKHILIHTEDHGYEGILSLCQCLSLLDYRFFFRTHRAYLVNLSQVRELYPTGRTYAARVGQHLLTVPVSREYHAALEKALKKG